MGSIKKESFIFKNKIYFTGLISLVVAILISSILLPESASAAKKQYEILLINSYHSSLKWSASINKSIKSEMDKLDFPVIIHDEFMDTKYKNSPEYLNLLEELYATKYSENKPDVIIVSDNNALEFLIARRAKLFPGIPVVFLGINAFKKEMLHGEKDITGVVEAISIRSTIEAALRLYPYANRVVAYASDMPTARHNSRIFLEKQDVFTGRARLELKTGMNVEQVVDDISSLPHDSVVLILSFLKGDKGILLPLEKTIEIVSSESELPVFSFWDFLLGHGIVGGELVSGADQGKIAGEMAARILGGEKASDIPINYESPNKYMFDFKQLNKIGFNPAGLPLNSIIVNQKKTFYSQHKAKVWFAVGLFIFMGLVILVLWRSAIARKRIEQALRRSKDMYDLVTMGTNDGIWDWDRKSGEVFFSSRWKEILGFSDEEIPNNIEEWKSRIHPDDYDRVIRVNDLFFTHKTDRIMVEYRMKAKDGSWKWVMGRGSCLRDEQGKPYRIAGAHTDITERKKAEEELRRLRNYLENIINSMPSILVGVDSNGVVNQWNFKAEEMTGISSKEACRMNLVEAFPGIADDYARIMASIEKGTTLVDPPRVLNLKDESRYREITVFPIDCDNGRGAVIRIDDVTQRVRLEQMMVQTEKMMSLGGLAAGMAHEINNPLAGILGNLHNLRRRLYSDLRLNDVAASEIGVSLEDMRRYLDKRDIPNLLDGIADSAGRAATIVRNMLSFSRISERLFEYYNIEQLLEETLELASSDYDLERRYDFKKIKIVKEYASGVPAVYCDGTEIRQVFLNLIKNAAEATAEKHYIKEEPCIILRTEIDSDMVLVKIEDNGPGLGDEEQKRVFEPFYTSKPVGSGTGLGLSVSYFIITDQHKGRMQVESVKGEWTRFTISLPAG
ncbi:ABC transporter substrate binding protein [Maridesulfovibrio bastinii]|uniref:ABC transporter substrate binding protein n=1 Tax=Maridesulfovibrio bastinii TaxID=47157 RepID=UPI00041B60D0|nr:ABC transporter substrate binding protein [Maridesulfovibrio bastinii]